MPLMERHTASEFFLGDFAVTASRTHKDAAEQELMRMSSAANDAVMVDAIKLVHEGVTEREIADQMLGLYRKHDCEGFSFPPIVSFGANTGDPHHEPDDTVLKRGDVVLFDIGGRRCNYCSDMTRTFFGASRTRRRSASTISCAAPTRPPRRSSRRACACAIWTVPRAT